MITSILIGVMLFLGVVLWGFLLDMFLTKVVGVQNTPDRVGMAVVITGVLFLAIFATHAVRTYNPGESDYFSDCTREARMLYDNFNDTVGASYAHTDQPSKEVQSFINRCIEYKELNE